MNLELIEIPRQSYDEGRGLIHLDPVTAFLQDFEPGCGQLTLVCWGRAWSHYWGAMGQGASLRKFIADASTDYLVMKLMLPYDVMLRRAEPREERWLTQIVDALKRELRKGVKTSPKREPLTEEQIWDAHKAEHHPAFTFGEFEAGVRFAEKHHLAEPATPSNDLMTVVEHILDAGHMNTEDLGRLRQAWEATSARG